MKLGVKIHLTKVYILAMSHGLQSCWDIVLSFSQFAAHRHRLADQVDSTASAGSRVGSGQRRAGIGYDRHRHDGARALWQSDGGSEELQPHFLTNIRRIIYYV
jgi:hypothetical protein